MYAVGVPWCVIIIWTPGSLYFHRIKKDPDWGKYIPALEDLYHDRLQRDELDDSTDSEEEKKRERGWGRHGQNSRWFGDLMRMEDVKAILRPPTAAFEELRFYVMQCFQIHLGRWIYLWNSFSRSGLKWRAAVDEYWSKAVRSLCEKCIRQLFHFRWPRYVWDTAPREVRDLVRFLLQSEQDNWTKLLYNPDFSCAVRRHLNIFQPTAWLLENPCTCASEEFRNRYLFLAPIRAMMLVNRAGP